MNLKNDDGLKWKIKGNEVNRGAKEQNICTYLETEQMPAAFL